MFDVVGEAVVHQLPRLGSLGSGTEKEVIAQRAEQTREARPVETTGGSARSMLTNNGDKDEQTRNRLEDGKIIVEKYDGDGKLVKRTPPGYLPFGEIA
jgi:hypothetical protein